MKEFANEIDVSESEIHNLIKKGMVTEKLLDMICTYFQIQKNTAVDALHSMKSSIGYRWMRNIVDNIET
ncbi:hypothetical protein ACT7DB_30875 [Bacillus cereus]